MRVSVRPVFSMTEHRGDGAAAVSSARKDSRADDGTGAPAALGMSDDWHEAVPKEEADGCKANVTFTADVGSASAKGADIRPDEKCPPGDGEGAESANRVVITEKFKIEFTVDAEFMERLARVRSLLSTKYPKRIDFETLFCGIISSGMIRRKEYKDGKSSRRRKLRKLA